MFFLNENKQFGLLIASRMCTYISNDDKTNADLKDYRGYFDLRLKIGKANSFALGTNFWWAKEGTSVQVDFTYPLHRFVFKNIDLYFQAQYVNRLAESLIDFRERTEAFRLGFGIVR